ncbi:glycosyltransferase family 2 protein [Leifsonia sp. 21MFCrub1.1]|uniref:glycosyltransferase family 2 protein n=1 Tax=Leifsonia sp. 21MFCrub1.1 TaxID=1798223 RepID=UPI000AD9BA59|nr:glycosyltransferase family 2 protein [Leifsonia sp. 21MFCrub1.1]
MTIDIMMPFYGDPALFRTAVESVVAQTDPRWRLVVVDDVYPDTEPGQWLRSLGDDRIRYVRNETNLGVAGNFTKCLDLVEAEYFVLMGCDDELEPGYVASMSESVEEYPTVSYFQPGVTVIDRTGSPSRPLPDRVKRLARPRVRGVAVLSGEDLASSLLRGNWTYFPSICWKTSVVRQHGFEADFEVVLDLALQLEIIRGGGSLVVLPDLLFRYRRHAGSVSSWSSKDGSRFAEERAFFTSARTLMADAGWRHAARVARFHMSSRLNAATKVLGAMTNRKWADVRSLLRHVFGS